jgi:hypothetical protein
MNQTSHRFSLDKIRQRKYRCPLCKRDKVFVRYVDQANGEYLGDDVGRCDREVNCGYHKKPKAYFQDNPLPQTIYKPVSEPVRPVEYFTHELMVDSVKMAGNHFLTYITKLFGIDIALDKQQKYFIGTSNSKWPGATVFWQMDDYYRVRYGKVIEYDPMTGKRIKEPYSHITAVHTLVGRPDMNYRQCFFGQHLLKEFPHKSVGILESEKSAVIMDILKPEYNWIATGGSAGVKITSETVQALRNKNIVMFPDAGCYDKWIEKAEKIKSLVHCNIKVSQVIEGAAKNSDIVDHLIRTDESGLAIENGYPVMWDYERQYSHLLAH